MRSLIFTFITFYFKVLAYLSKGSSELLGVNHFLNGFMMRPQTEAALAIHGDGFLGRHTTNTRGALSIRGNLPFFGDARLRFIGDDP